MSIQNAGNGFVTYLLPDGTAGPSFRMCYVVTYYDILGTELPGENLIIVGNAPDGKYTLVMTTAGIGYYLPGHVSAFLSNFNANQ